MVKGRAEKKVSVIIPCYNEGEYIGEAIESALNQDYPNIEVVVSDNESTDTTEEVVAQYVKKDSRVKYFRNSPNIGMEANFRKSLYEYASGDLAITLSGDDYLVDCGYISRAVSIFEKDPQVVLVFGRIKSYFQNEKLFIEDNVNVGLPEINDGDHFFLNYYKGYSIPLLTVVYDRTYALSMDFFCLDAMSLDLESFFRAMLKKKVGFVDKCVGVWRKHALNLSRSTDPDTIVKNCRYIELPYQYALQKGYFSKHALDLWRHKMLKRYYLKNAIKIIMLNRKQSKSFFRSLRLYDHKVYRAVRFDARLALFRLLLLSKGVARFVFRHILKSESFLIDLNLNK